MKQIKKALIAIDFPKEELDKMENLMDAETVVRCASTEEEKIVEALKDAEVAILGRPVKNCAEVIGSSLRWLHCDAAGLDFLYTPSMAENARLSVTCSSGRSSKALAEHVIMFMLALNYRLNEVWEARKDRAWSMPFLSNAKALVGQTAGILGAGSIARELAPRLKALGMRNLAYAKHTKEADGIDAFYAGEDGLKKLLEESDFVISTIPLTDETYHLLNAANIAKMKKTAYLINISRGAVIDEKALCSALQNGIIAGAGLDTFETEPLGKESDLWTMKNVILTPHVTPPQPDKHKISVDVIFDNISLYREGRPLKNQYQPYYRFSGKK